MSQIPHTASSIMQPSVVTLSALSFDKRFAVFWIINLSGCKLLLNHECISLLCWMQKYTCSCQQGTSVRNVYQPL